MTVLAGEPMAEKVYNECFHCPKFNQCDDIAMVVRL